MLIRCTVYQWFWQTDKLATRKPCDDVNPPSNLSENVPDVRKTLNVKILIPHLKNTNPQTCNHKFKEETYYLLFLREKHGIKTNKGDGRINKRSITYLTYYFWNNLNKF